MARTPQQPRGAGPGFWRPGDDKPAKSTTPKSSGGSNGGKASQTKPASGSRLSKEVMSMKFMQRASANTYQTGKKRPRSEGKGRQGTQGVGNGIQGEEMGSTGADEAPETTQSEELTTSSEMGMGLRRNFRWRLDATVQAPAAPLPVASEGEEEQEEGDFMDPEPDLNLHVTGEREAAVNVRRVLAEGCC